MNNLKIVLYTIIAVTAIHSCKKETEPAPTVQQQLNEGISIETLLENYPLDSLYGKEYAGGLIFYINEADGTGMVAAPTDQSSTASWADMEDDIVGAMGTEIGLGKSNTKAIVDSCSQSFAAAVECNSLDLNGYDDWFLPSEDELLQVYQKLYLKGHGDLSENYYWTSTKKSVSTSSQIYFGTGAIGSATRSNLHYVRAVRAF